MSLLAQAFIQSQSQTLFGFLLLERNNPINVKERFTVLVSGASC
nr:MAG TPA: hypothetical protein [Caudoviricetes sp.]